MDLNTILDSSNNALSGKTGFADVNATREAFIELFGTRWVDYNIWTNGGGLSNVFYQNANANQTAAGSNVYNVKGAYTGTRYKGQHVRFTPTDSNNVRDFAKLTTLSGSPKVENVRYFVMAYRCYVNGHVARIGISTNDGSGTGNWEQMEASGAFSGFALLENNKTNWNYIIIDLMGGDNPDVGIAASTKISDLYLRMPTFSASEGDFLDVACFGFFDNYQEAEQFGVYGATAGTDTDVRAEMYITDTTTGTRVYGPSDAAYRAETNAVFSLMNDAVYYNKTGTTPDGYTPNAFRWIFKRYNNGTYEDSVCRVSTGSLTNYLNITDTDLPISTDTTSGDADEQQTGHSVDIGYSLFEQVSSNAMLGLLESSLDENGRPVYKKSVVEYKGAGTHTTGSLLMSTTAGATEAGNTYLHPNNSNLFLGYREDNLFYNSGISWEIVGNKLGISDTEVKNGVHTYKLVNEVDGTNNKIRLYVDGVDIGYMNQVKMVGNNASHANVGNINISGKDFVFNYFGTTEYPMRDYGYEYIAVYENGEISNEKTSFNDYRWSVAEDQFLTASNVEGFTRNPLTQHSGFISNGEFNESRFQTDKPVVLVHDMPWSVEWVSSGSWRDTNTGALLMATDNNSRAMNAPYLYRRSASDLIAFGEYDGGTHHNYGVCPAEFGIDATVPHTYRLTNRIAADGSNMVYLYIDDVEIGAMDNYYIGGTDMNAKSDWVNGKDFVFSYLGVTGFEIGNCNLEYLQVWEQGSYEHNLDTYRLQQLLDTRLTEKTIPNTNGASYTDASWTVYTDAINAAQTLLNDLNEDNTQTDINNAVDAIVKARYKLVSDANTAISADLDAGNDNDAFETDKIYDVQLLTGTTSRIGKQSAVRIVTTSDVAQVGIGSQKQLVCTSQIQTIQINGVDTVVKIWLITWQRSNQNPDTITYGVGAYTDPDANIKVTENKDYQDYTKISVIYQ